MAIHPWTPVSRLSLASRLAAIILPALAVAALVSALLAKSAQFNAKPAGSPLVEFEIQLPPGILLPDDRNISVTLWNGHSGTGCKVTEVRRSGTRPVVAGRFVVRSGEQRLSLRFGRYAEGFWEMPVEPHTAVNRDFGPWQGIQFNTDRMEESPLPPGHYDVRYRVAKYI
jgi:hypothetical protein